MSFSRSASEQTDGIAFPLLDAEQASDLSIEIVITEIVHKHFGLSDVDCSQWIQQLRSNLVVNFGLLCRLDAKRLEKLQLPLMLEDELSRIIEEFQDRNGISTRRTRREKRPKPPALIKPPDRGALLGLSDEMRASIKQSWSYVTGKTRDGFSAPALTAFFEEFYRNFLNMDKVGRKLFEGASLNLQAQALMKMMTFIMQTLDNPVKLIVPLRKLGARHLIYGVERRNFQSFGIALSKTFEAILGPEMCSSNMKEAWYILIQNIGDIMMEDFDEIRAGWPSHVWKKDGSKWRLYPSLLTHERLVLFKNEERTKMKEETILALVDSLDLEEEDIVGTTKPNPYCFSLTAGATVKSYYAAESEEELLKWSEEIIQRIRAHQRVNQTTTSESDSKDSVGSSEEDNEPKHSHGHHGSAKAIAAKKIGKLKSGLKVKRGSSAK